MPGTAIVALPSSDEHVYKVSSEKTPHLTLLFLGETTEEQNKLIAEFLEHVVDTSLTRFGLSVDRRGELGDKDADVLFFKKNWDVKPLSLVRHYLLMNDTVKSAYDATPNHWKIRLIGRRGVVRRIRSTF